MNYIMPWMLTEISKVTTKKHNYAQKDWMRKNRIIKFLFNLQEGKKNRATNRK